MMQFPRFAILTVCTGNVCRSPLAAQLLRHRLGRWPVDVASAGTGALVGAGMPEQTAAIAHQLGLPAAQHSARDLTLTELREADLVIALTRAHRSEIVSMLPRISRQTFTLRELARLLDAVPPADMAEIAALPLDDTVGRFAQLVASAAALRGHVIPPERDEDDDVIDPYRQSDEVHRASAEQLVPAVDTIAGYFERAATAQ